MAVARFGALAQYWLRSSCISLLYCSYELLFINHPALLDLAFIGDGHDGSGGSRSLEAEDNLSTTFHNRATLAVEA